MYAIIRTGGKQQRVEPGDVIEVEFMHVDPGSEVEFQPMVVFDDDGKAHVGKALSRAKVTATLLGEQKGEKVKVFKYRPKSGYRRTQGHRQLMTILEIQEVGLSPDKKVTKADVPAREPLPPPSLPPKKETAKKPAAKKPAAKKPAAKKPAAKKPAAKKTPAKKTGARKSTARRKPS